MSDNLDASNCLERRSLKLEAWPEADRKAWIDAVHSEDWLEAPGFASSWAEATRRSAVQGYGRWLAWLVWTDRLDRNTAPVSRVTPEAVAHYAQNLQKHMAGSTVHVYVNWLLLMSKGMAPDADLNWLRNVVIRLRRQAAPAEDKRGRLVPIKELFAFGIELMTQFVIEAEPLSWQAATQYRDGLMISLLAARVPRMRNFMSIEIDKHLIRQGDKYLLRFDASETKNRRQLDTRLPDALMPYLERYRRYVRPRLCELRGPCDQSLPFIEPGNRLWVSRTGSAMSKEAFAFMLRKRTTAKFGHSINPHLFRSCAATSVATDDPDHVQMTAALLGHTTLKTSERYYNYARANVAAQRYQQNILALRKTRER